MKPQISSRTLTCSFARKLPGNFVISPRTCGPPSNYTWQSPQLNGHAFIAVPLWHPTKMRAPIAIAVPLCTYEPTEETRVKASNRCEVTACAALRTLIATEGPTESDARR